jgi:hypothetical protein
MMNDVRYLRAPTILAALAQHLADSNYDLKSLMRDILLDAATVTVAQSGAAERAAQGAQQQAEQAAADARQTAEHAVAAAHQVAEQVVLAARADASRQPAAQRRQGAVSRADI